MGTLVFQATLGGSINLIGPNTASTVNFTLPSADGTSGQALVTNGSGTLSFSSVTTAPAGSNTQVQFNNSGVFGASSSFTWDGAQITVNGITVGRGAGAVSTNTAVGASALAANTSGANQTVIGSGAASSTTTGTANTVFGRTALNANTNGSSNVCVGYQAMQNSDGASNNTAIGTAALISNTANNNTAVGYQAGYYTTSGANTYLGTSAGYGDATGSSNTFVGYYAGPNTVSNASGTQNVGIGRQALYSNTTASNNTAVGYQAGYSNTTGTDNIAIGYQAGYYITTGSYNVMLGDGVMNASASGVAASNTVAVGYQALRFNNANDNTAVGFGSAYANTTGAYNTAIGRSALASNTTASNNTAVGYQAGYTNSTGPQNTFLGMTAGYTSTGGYNTLLGYSTGYSLTTGQGNTFVGAPYGTAPCGYYVTTGSKNTILGGYNGNQGGLDIRTASNYIVLSDGDGNPRGIFNDSGKFWIGTTSAPSGATATQLVAKNTTNDYVFWLENSHASSPYGGIIKYSGASPNGTANEFLTCTDSTAQRATIRSNGGIANYSANNVNLSDRREKTNFAPAKSYLDVICSIPVQTYNYIDQNLEEDAGQTLGVVAQDVQAVAPELVTESNWGTEEDPKMRLSIYQTDLQYALMKCIQELKAEIDTLKGN